MIKLLAGSLDLEAAAAAVCGGICSAGMADSIWSGTWRPPAAQANGISMLSSALCIAGQGDAECGKRRKLV